MPFDFSNVFSQNAIMRVAVSGQVLYALWDGAALIAYNGSPFANGGLSGRKLDVRKVAVLSPCEPSKIPAIGLNYHEHAREMNKPAPEEPLLFMKPASSVIGFGSPVIMPALSRRIDFEGELGIVMGKACRAVTESEALDFVMGYTCLNDITARDLQAKDGQYTRAKCFDTFCPIGPAIALDVEPGNLKIKTTLNGKLFQDSSTFDMIFSIEQMVAYVSSVMTLNPGDVIATGTPSGISTMQAGDTVCVELEGIGRLINPLTK